MGLTFTVFYAFPAMSTVKPGAIVVGDINSGSVTVGDTVTLKRTDGFSKTASVVCIHKYNQKVTSAQAGDSVKLLLRGITKNDLEKGDLLIKEEHVTTNIPTQPFRLVVENSFVITGRGTAIVGQVTSGSVRTGDTVTLQRLNGEVRTVTVTGIEKFRKMLNVANAGDNVGLFLLGVMKSEIGNGDVLIKK